MIVKYKDHASAVELCKWAQVARSSFHYKPKIGKRGMKASTHTLIGDGVVENALVVNQIRAILTMDYCVYGYHKMTIELRDMAYVINPKKVYRLMKENHLLSGKRIKAHGKRKFVKQSSRHSSCMHLKVFTDNGTILVNEDCFVHSGWGQRATLCIYY